MNCYICGNKLDFKENPINKIIKPFESEIRFYCSDCHTKAKTLMVLKAQKFDFVVNRIAENNQKISRLNQIAKSEGIQLVINYIHDENKNLLKFLK